MEFKRIKWRLRYTSHGTFVVVFNDGTLGSFHYPSIDAFLGYQALRNVD